MGELPNGCFQDGDGESAAASRFRCWIPSTPRPPAPWRRPVPGSRFQFHGSICDHYWITDL